MLGDFLYLYAVGRFTPQVNRSHGITAEMTIHPHTTAPAQNWAGSPRRQDAGHRHHRLLWQAAFWLTLTVPIARDAQQTETPPPDQSGPSLIEEVYEHRISLLQDSLFTSKEQLEAAHFLVQQSERLARAYADSTALFQSQAQQLADSLSHLLILHDRLAAENRQNLARLSALSDSMVQSYRREQALRQLNDSLMVILGEAREYLDLASDTEGAYSDSIAALRNTLMAIQEKLVASEANLAGIYEQMGGALAAADDAEVDAEADERFIRYLADVINYNVEVRGLSRLFSGGGKGAELTDFKLRELRDYLAWMSLRGHTPDALNLLAQTYLEQDDEIRGTLIYLKTLFIYPDTEAGRYAREEVERLVVRSSDEGRLFYEVVLNPDSMNVGEDYFYRYLHYLDHIRGLGHPTAREWFITEAHHFLSLYPNVFQADKLLLWIGQSYHGLNAYHKELLIYTKIRTLYPHSSYIPDVTFAMAEVTAHDLREYERGAERYAEFREAFPNHAKSPVALFAEAEL